MSLGEQEEIEQTLLFPCPYIMQQSFGIVIISVFSITQILHQIQHSWGEDLCFCLEIPFLLLPAKTSPAGAHRSLGSDWSTKWNHASEKDVEKVWVFSWFLISQLGLIAKPWHNSATAGLTSFLLGLVIWQAAKTLRLKQQFLLGPVWNPLYTRVIPWLWLISARRVWAALLPDMKVRESRSTEPDAITHSLSSTGAALQDCWRQRGSFSSSKLNFSPAMRALSARDLLGTGNVIMGITWFVTGLIHPTRTESKTHPQTIFHIFYWNDSLKRYTLKG